MTELVLEEGQVSFAIESRLLRELGERLVKRPEVAVVELIKNAYDADATECKVICNFDESISVEDNGTGMNINHFSSGWMRIGTSLKESLEFSRKYGRRITGEKGLGRFAVRFLGHKLHLESVADDPDRKCRTRLIADFNWPEFDINEELGKVQVPYSIVQLDNSSRTGTKLEISSLRISQRDFDLNKVQTSSISVVSPLRSMIQQIDTKIFSADNAQAQLNSKQDPGLTLISYQTGASGESTNGTDIAEAVLNEYTIRANLKLDNELLDLRIYQYGNSKPCLKIVDSYPSQPKQLFAEIRFFPRRKGAFVRLPVDGRRAYTWIGENSGVAVYDRNFRVSPYGMESNDWLMTDVDVARNRREPRSSLAQKHFPMSVEQRNSTSENWMLRLPMSVQLIGLVCVEGQRENQINRHVNEGLIAAADREGFIENQSFENLFHLIRGMVEAIAFVDRKIQRKQKEQDRVSLLDSMREETLSAIKEIKQNARISDQDKDQIISAIARTQKHAEEQEESHLEQSRQIEVMSLLGVVAGFMTHELGVAIQELEDVRGKLDDLTNRDPDFGRLAQDFSLYISNLKEFVKYASGYIQGAKVQPEKPYSVKPRVQQVSRIFGQYAQDRNIDIDIQISTDLTAPLVPVSLYNGISLNLYTNALKSVTAKLGRNRGKIVFRAWNDSRWHYLQVLDTGIGIPSTLEKRVFDPLFTTTHSHNDPLGSGMGLGLALVKRCVESFGGYAEVVKPPSDFSTCVQIRLPVKGYG